MLVTLFGTACGSSEGGDQGSSSQGSGEAETTRQQSESNASSRQDLGVGDTGTFQYGDTTTIYSYASPVQPDNPAVQPKAGNQFAVIDVEGCAGPVEVTGPDGNTQLMFDPFSFVLQMPDNTRLQSTVPAVDPALNAVNLSAGDCVRGNVTFEVPQGQTPSYVVQEPTTPPARWAIE